MGQYLDRIPGQVRACQHLEKILLSRRIPHALLFSGPKGIGKFFTALQFTKELNSLNGELTPQVKKKISHFEEPFVKIIHVLPRGKSESNSDLPTAKLGSNQIVEINEQVGLLKENPYNELHIAKAQNIKINSIRELRKFLSLKYDEASYRVVILYEAHNMSLDSQNAVLKSLEEPPDDVVIILHTSNPDLLLSTIKSRCQEVKFDHLSSDTLGKILIDFFDHDSSTAAIVSKFADGSVIKAMKLIEDDLEGLLEECINILRYALARRYQTAFAHFYEITERWGEEGFYITLDFIGKWFLDAIRDRSEIEPEYFYNYKDTIVKFNQRYGNYELTELLGKLEYLGSLRRRNINLNICISNVIFQIGHIGVG